MNNQTLSNELSGKNEQIAQKAANEIVENANTDAFALVVEKMEFLFDFIKNNVNRRLKSAVTSENYRNIFKFMNYYSPDLEDFISGTLSEYANEDLTDELLELLVEGNDSQKTYCAKYFSYIPDTAASETLIDYAFCDNESLAYNSAVALGCMKCEISYQMALEMMNSEDDFVILKAVKFLTAYGDKAASGDILKVMKKSALSENIAGELPFLMPLKELLEKENRDDVLFAISKILSGLGEILPLSQVFNFEMYDVLGGLIKENETKTNSLASVILLKALSKFEMICANDEYTYDEDKETKTELNEILKLLQAPDEAFWARCLDSVKDELVQEKERVLSAIHLISELKIGSALDELKKLTESEDEVVICEAVCAVKSLGRIGEIDKNSILARVSDENKKAIIENCFMI